MSTEETTTKQADVAEDAVDALLDGLERFGTVVAAIERPDLSPSSRDAESAIKGLRSWGRRTRVPSDHGLPPHLVACVSLDPRIGDVLRQHRSLPVGLTRELQRFSADLADTIAVYKATAWQRTTLLMAPRVPPFEKSLANAGDLVKRAKRLMLRLAASRDGQPTSVSAPVPMTLSDAAILVRKTKAALESYKARKYRGPGKPLPPADYKGQPGQPDRWNWETLRPWLVQTFNVPLPIDLRLFDPAAEKR